MARSRATVWPICCWDIITYSGGARLDNPQYLRARSWNLFVQDSYRLRRNVTLLFGVRYEYNSPPVDRYDRANSYDPLTKTLVPVGAGECPPRRL